MLSLPTMNTIAVTSIGPTSAMGGGNVTCDGGDDDFFESGVCWSTSANLTIDDIKTINDSGSDNFTSSITSLIPGATYYVRAYATNSVGTSYGNDINFETSYLSTFSYITSDGNCGYGPLLQLNSGCHCQRRYRIGHFGETGNLCRFT